MSGHGVSEPTRADEVEAVTLWVCPGCGRTSRAIKKPIVCTASEHTYEESGPMMEPFIPKPHYDKALARVEELEEWAAEAEFLAEAHQTGKRRERRLRLEEIEASEAMRRAINEALNGGRISDLPKWAVDLFEPFCEHHGGEHGHGY